jgi:hypothetical protein
LDYLNHDRLVVCDLDQRLEGGGRELQRRLRDHGIEPLRRESAVLASWYLSAKDSHDEKKRRLAVLH